MRGQVMQIREREYVHAAQMIGAPLLRDTVETAILPNTFPRCW
jgi:ABC-type dipeptide/oligopeptide/nickel transport system permease subunit